MAAGAARQTDEAARFSARFVLAYRWIAAAVGLLSLGWAIFFAVQGIWALTASQSVVALVAAVGIMLSARGRLATALLLTQVAYLFSIILLCLVFDVPSAEAPRVSHLFLLVLALVGYLNFKRQPSLLQMGWLVHAFWPLSVYPVQATPCLLPNRSTTRFGPMEPGSMPVSRRCR